MSTFGVLAGSLALEEKPFHKQALDVIQRVFAKANGYVAYKLTRLGRVSDDDVPSFLVILVNTAFFSLMWLKIT